MVKNKKSFLKTWGNNPNHKYIIDEEGRQQSREIAKKYIYLKNGDKYSLPFSKYVVHHIDGETFNDSVKNLYICTEEQHMAIHQEQISRMKKFANSSELDYFLKSKGIKGPTPLLPIKKRNIEEPIPKLKPKKPKEEPKPIFPIRTTEESEEYWKEREEEIERMNSENPPKLPKPVPKPVKTKEIVWFIIFIFILVIGSWQLNSYLNKPETLPEPQIEIKTHIELINSNYSCSELELNKRPAFCKDVCKKLAGKYIEHICTGDKGVYCRCKIETKEYLPVKEEKDIEIIEEAIQPEETQITPPEEENTSPASIPEVKPIVVEGSNTDIIIKNNQGKSISLNVNYRIYSRWFGADYQESKVFDVGANSQQSFKVYNNDGCSTAPCSVSIISYEEV